MNKERKHRDKRKRHVSFSKSRIGQRLEKLRVKPEDLWLDDNPLFDSTNEKLYSSKGKSHKKLRTNSTCLICSILSQLSSYNCCSEHLISLKNNSHQQWLPDQVMIVPMTSEIVQKYLTNDQIHQLQSKTLDNEQGLEVDLQKTTDVTEDLPPLASTITIETAISDDHSFETLPNKPPTDPWIPISDEVDAALEEVLQRIDSSLEYSPRAVRNLEPGVLPSRLPKIPLKQGRFRHGKPIPNQSTSNAANEYRPLATVQSTPPSSSSSPSTTNVFTQDQNRPCETSRTTPSRISFRTNPDGTRVRISRPPLPMNQQSPLSKSLRRTSTEVEPRSK